MAETNDETMLNTEETATNDVLNITINDAFALRYGIPNMAQDEKILVRQTRDHLIDMPYTILKSPEDGSYILVFRAQNSGNLLIPCRTIEDLKTTLNTLNLNYIAMRMQNSDAFLESLSESRAEIDEYLVIGKDGLDATIPRKITKLLGRIREIYMLGNASKDDDTFYSIEQAEKMEIIDGINALDAAKDDVHGKSQEFIDRVQWIRKLEEKFTPEKRREVKFLYEELRDALLLMKEHPNSYVTTNLALLRADDRELMTEEEAIKFILNKVSTVEPNGRLLYDFSNDNIPNEIQDLLLRHLIGGEYELSEAQRKACEDYKYSSVDINTFLRGRISETNIIFKEKFKSMLEDIIELEKLASALPKRDFDIVVHRIGLGSTKDITEGSRNLYDSFVSFGTDSGTKLESAQHGAYRYRRVLRAEDKAIPLDQICTEVWAERESECEVLLMPFSFTVGNISRYDPKYPDVDMEEIENLDILKILKLRMENFLETYKMQEGDKFKRLPEEDEANQKRIRGYVEDPANGKQIKFEEAISSLKESGEYEDFLNFDNSISTDYYQYRGSKLHGFNHTRRVAFNARLLANMEGLSPEDKKVLLFAAKYHDIGRRDDNEDVFHGRRSAEKLDAYGLMEEFSFEDRELIRFIVEEHCLSKSQNAFDLSRIPEGKRARYEKLLYVLKDADKLDRVRLGKFDGLTPDRLMLESSKKLIELAYESFMYLGEFIESERGERVAKDVEEVLGELNDYLENRTVTPVSIKPLAYKDYRQERMIATPREEYISRRKRRMAEVRAKIDAAKETEEVAMSQDEKDLRAAAQRDREARCYPQDIDRQALYSGVISATREKVGGQALSKTIKKVIKDGKNKLESLVVREGTEKD